MPIIAKKSLKSIIKEEYEKCALDVKYFLKKYAVIQHPKRGKIPFILYPFQETVTDQFISHRYNVILKSRQLGISTLVAGYIIWMMTFHKDKNILIIATKQDVAKNLVTKVRVMYQGLPSWLRVAAEEDNKLSLKLVNGSQVKAISSGPEGARSEALSLLVLDEAAFIDKMGEIWTAANQTLAMGGDCIALSCVTKDTFVFTDKGITEVRNFIPNESIPGDYKISRYNIRGNNKLRKSDLFHNNGIVKTYKIKTKFTELEGSFNHKLWACKDGKYDWHELQTLEIGDWVNVQYGMNCWGNNDGVGDFNPNINSNHKNIFKPNKITPNIAYLIGLYLAEGSSQKRYKSNGDIYYSGLDFTCGDDISSIFTKLNLKYYLAKDNLHYNISSSTLIQFFEYLGFDLSAKAQNKIIPDRLFEMSKKNICSMLSGIFDGDGFSTSDKGIVGIGLSNKKLIQQIRILLLNLGITSCYSSVSKEKMNNYNYFEYGFNYDSHRLELDYSNSKLFYEYIGFWFDRKQKNKILLERYNLERGDSHNVIPYSLDIMYNLFNCYPKGLWSLQKNYGLNINGVLNKKNRYKSEHICTKNVHKLYEIVKNNLSDETINYLNKIIIPNSEWVQIKKIEESENETFDFSLPTDNNFWCNSIIYNGLLGHNTPNGMGNWFHQTWQKSLEKENNFFPIVLPWSVHPEHDQAWRDEQTIDLGERMATQECDADFLASGETVIHPEILKFYEKTFVKEPYEKRGIDHNYWIWEQPDYTRTYIVAADVSRGDGTDYSTAHVIDVENMRQVAEYKGMIDTTDFGNFLVTIATEYNNALLIIERENIGWAVIQQVINRQYANLFYSSGDLKYVDTLRQVTNKYRTAEKKLKPGFSTTVKSRPLIISKIEQCFREKMIVVQSQRTISEGWVFVWKGNKAEARDGYNDDLLMAMGIGLWVRDTALKLQQEGIDLTKMTINKFRVENSYDAVYKPTMPNSTDPYSMNLGDKSEDIRWLLG